TGAKVVETAPFYIFGTFIVSYGTQNLNYSQTATLTAVTIATIITTILMPIMGSLSDKVGRKKLYVGGTILMILYAFPYFCLIHKVSIGYLIVATVIVLVIIWELINTV